MVLCVVAAARRTIRRWVRQPVFPILGIASVAIAIAVSTAVFALVEGVLFRPLPVKAPSGLYEVHSISPWPHPLVFRIPDYPAIRRAIDGQVIRDVIGYGIIEGFLADPLAGRRVIGEAVTPNYFSVLGLIPQVGSFLALTDGSADESSCVISDTVWRGVFGEDPHVVGRQFAFNGAQLVVAAVAPRQFRGLFAPGIMRTDIWMTVPTALRVHRGTSTLMFRIGLRVSEPTTAARVTASLKWVLSSEVLTDPSDVPYAHFKGLERAMPVLDHLLLVAGISALAGTMGVLLAVCANLAILLLTSALERRPELALRTALGARRRDIVTDVVAESVLMAAVGGVGGVFLARAALIALGTFQPGQGPGLQYDFVAAIDWRVIAFSLGATSMACLGCALVALRSLCGLSLETLLGTAEVTTARRRGLLPSLLMTAHVAVTVALIAVAVYAVKSRMDQTDRDVGFDRSQLTFAMLRNDSPSADMDKVIGEIEHRLAGMPGVVSVSHSASMPFAGDPMGGRVGIGRAMNSASIVQVGREYFETLGIPRLQGRGFVADDFLPLPAAALLSASTARQWFGDRDPLGQVMEISATQVTVVGVVADVDHGTGLGRAKPTVYLPLSLCPASVYVLVRGRPALTVSALQRVVASSPQGIGVASLDSVRNLMDSGAWYPVRTSAAIALLLGLIAAVTCTMGQYAVVARAAVRRRREMAVRCVLGARGQDVLWQLLRGQVVTLAIGAALGTWAIIVSRWLLGTVLSGGLQVGWGAMVASCLLVMVVSAVACVAAAFRATRVTPASLLRQL